MKQYEYQQHPGFNSIIPNFMYVTVKCCLTYLLTYVLIYLLTYAYISSQQINAWATWNAKLVSEYKREWWEYDRTAKQVRWLNDEIAGVCAREKSDDMMEKTLMQPEFDFINTFHLS